MAGEVRRKNMNINVKEIKDKTVGYLKEINSESKKVTWPSQNYVVAATIIVFIIVFLVAIFVMTVDLSFARLFKFLTGGRLR